MAGGAAQPQFSDKPRMTETKVRASTGLKEAFIVTHKQVLARVAVGEYLKRRSVTPKNERNSAGIGTLTLHVLKPWAKPALIGRVPGGSKTPPLYDDSAVASFASMSVPRLTRSGLAATRRRASRRAPGRGESLIPHDTNAAKVEVEGRSIQLTNLQKLFWPDEGITKGDLLRFYAEIAEFLLPHLADRAMVMKRYPNGAAGPFFFQKRAPVPRPDWIDTCAIEHTNSGIIDFPIVRDLASLLWTINLGCIDLNPWYARCDDVRRPDYLHFDLDPVPEAGFDKVRQTALIVHHALEAIKIPSFAKTTGSRGIHVYVPIVRGPDQKQVWTFAKSFAQSLERLHPELITAEYRIAKRPKGHVLVDYNQNAWGRTLASVYSVRPKPRATVSTPVTWSEMEAGVETEDFRLDNVTARLRKKGDLWKPLVQRGGRVKLDPFLE